MLTIGHGIWVSGVSGDGLVYYNGFEYRIVNRLVSREGVFTGVADDIVAFLKGGGRTICFLHGRVEGYLT